MLMRCLLIVCLGFLWMPVCADVYKWVDEYGRVHYGEKPPHEQASKIEIKETPQAAESIEKQTIDQEKLLRIYEEERNIKKEEKLKAEQERNERKLYCRELANDLKDMQHGGVNYYELDAQGERVYLSEAEVAKRIREMQTEYDKNCK